MEVQHLKKYIKNKGISGATCAKFLGVTRSQISLILSGRRQASVSLCKKIIKLTGFCPVCGMSKH